MICCTTCRARFSSNNPLTRWIDPGSVLARMTYAHTCYTRASVAAQRELHLINTDRLAFAGAWQGWGFHEDGCVSGVRAAASLGADW